MLLSSKISSKHSPETETPLTKSHSFLNFEVKVDSPIIPILNALLSLLISLDDTPSVLSRYMTSQ